MQNSIGDRLQNTQLIAPNINFKIKRERLFFGSEVMAYRSGNVLVWCQPTESLIGITAIVTAIIIVINPLFTFYRSLYYLPVFMIRLMSSRPPYA